MVLCTIGGGSNHARIRLTAVGDDVDCQPCKSQRDDTKSNGANSFHTASCRTSCFRRGMRPGPGEQASGHQGNINMLRTNAWDHTPAIMFVTPRRHTMRRERGNFDSRVSQVCLPSETWTALDPERCLNSTRHALQSSMHSSLALQRVCATALWQTDNEPFCLG